MNSPEKQILYWQKCRGDIWCNLLKINLEHVHFQDMEGVYVIWHGALNPKTVYVGQGVIKDRLKEHRENQEILKYQNYNLYATWAKVSSNLRDGIEKYLITKLSPIVGEKAPDSDPIEVNLPW